MDRRGVAVRRKSLYGLACKGGTYAGNLEEFVFDGPNGKVGLKGCLREPAPNSSFITS
jgi:hypothetical protein